MCVTLDNNYTIVRTTHYKIMEFQASLCHSYNIIMEYVATSMKVL